MSTLGNGLDVHTANCSAIAWAHPHGIVRSSQHLYDRDAEQEHWGRPASVN